MGSSITRKATIRKYGPLAFLYPFAAAVGLVSTDYVAHAINIFSQSSIASTHTNANKVAVTTSTTPTTSDVTTAELNQIAQLTNKIEKLKQQLQTVEGGTSSATLPPSAVVIQPTIPPLGNHGANPKTITTSPPVTHGSTGASSVIK